MAVGFPHHLKSSMKGLTVAITTNGTYEYCVMISHVFIYLGMHAVTHAVITY